MAISTNGTVIARLAGGLYNTVMSNATYLEVASQDPSALANTLYARDFAKSTDLEVATTLLANLGLASQAGLDAWVAAQLTAAGAANKGAKIVSLLNDFAGLSADATWGTYATAFNTKVDAALATSQKASSLTGVFASSGAVAVANLTFALTAARDFGVAFTGGAGDDTYTATVATLGSLDSIDGGAGNDTLSITDTGNILTQPATVVGIETLTVNSSAGTIGSAGVVEKVATKQDVTYTFTSAYGTSIGIGPIKVTVGGVSLTVGTSATTYNTVSDVGDAIATLLGATATVVSSNVGGASNTGTINIKAATAGKKLPVISFENGSYTAPGSTTAVAGDRVDVTPNTSYSFPVTNVPYQAASDEVVSSTFTVPTGVTTATLTAATSLKASSVSTAATTAIGTDVTLSGGASQNITASDSVYASGTKGAIVIAESATPATGFYVAATTSGTGSGIKTAWGTSLTPVAGILATGGSTVNITGKGGVISSTTKNVTSTNTTPVQVGSAVNVSSAGSATGTETVRNAGMNPTGDVVVTNQSVHTDANGYANNLFSTGAVSVYTNGSSSVSVTGAGAVTVTDIGTTMLVPSTGVAAVAGTSKLTSVSLSGISDTANITSDAITTVTLTDTVAARTVNILNSGTSGANSGAINIVVSNAGASAAPVVFSNATATSVNLGTAAASAYQVTGGTSGGASVATNSGSKSWVTLTTPKATSITMTNALAVDIGTATSIGKVGTINASGASGAVTTTIGSATENGMIFTGGSGKDSVTLTGDVSVTSTTKATTVALGAGDDNLLNSSATTTFTGATFDGGDGVDTVGASLITVGNASKFTNFETLGLDKLHNTTTDITILGGITGLSLLPALAALETATYTSVTQAKGLTVGGTTSGGTVVLDFGSTVAATTDSYTVTFAATGATAAASPTAINAGKLSIEGIEAVTIASGGSGYTNNSIVLKDAAARTLTVTGNQNANITFLTAFGTDNVASTSSAGVSLIDASALTGKLTLDLGNVKNAFAGATIKGGSSDDTITLTTETNAGTAGYTVIAGAGNDNIITVNEASNLTGGTGNDNFDVTATKANVSQGASDSDIRFTTITDFSSGDTIKMGTTTVATAGKALVLNATSLSSSLNLALRGIGADAAAWFVYGADTYVVVEDSVDGLSTNDIIVKLTGVTSDITWTNSASGLIGVA